jgi:glutamine synthetase
MDHAPASASPEAIEKVRATLKDHSIDRVLVMGADAHGQSRGKFIPRWRFEKDPTEALHIADVLAIMDIEDEMMPRPDGFTGWWPSWESGYADFEAVADLDTFAPAPWIDGSAVVLCDYYNHDGSLVPFMPRSLLRSVVDRASGMGLTARMATEYEFFVFRETMKSAREKGFRDLEPLTEGAKMYGGERAHADLPLTAAIEAACESLGVAIEAVVPEGGPSQFELNLTPQDALRAADEGFLFKYAVKRITESMGYTASFMAKMAPGAFGSSMHVHQSLWDADDRNVFFEAGAEHGLSVIGRQYTAGMTRTLREFTAVFAPFITSYKRFEPEAAAGTPVAWSLGNRSTAIRVIDGAEHLTRIENRTPGADANPYLVLAAMLAGGLWGIENDLDPGPAYTGNAYADPALETVPHTLAEALDLFEQSEVANKFFGEDVVQYLAAIRRFEVEKFNNAVTDWELSRYFGNV